MAWLYQEPFSLDAVRNNARNQKQDLGSFQMSAHYGAIMLSRALRWLDELT